MRVLQNTTLRKRTCGLSGNGCGVTDVLWRITPIKIASSGRLLRRRWENNCGDKKPVRISDERAASWGSNGSRRTVRRRKGGSNDCRNAAGPLGKGNALGRDRQPRCRESFFGDALSSGVGTAFHGGTSQAAQCPSTVGSRTAVGGNSKRARGSPGSRRSQRQLGGHPLGRATRRSMRGSSRSAGGSRTASGWLTLAPLPRPLSPLAPLPSTPATVRKSFRPTASRTCGTKSKTKRQNQTQIPCACRAPLEETVEPDISILRKTGHFYFALT